MDPYCPQQPANKNSPIGHIVPAAFAMAKNFIACGKIEHSFNVDVDFGNRNRNKNRNYPPLV